MQKWNLVMAIACLFTVITQFLALYGNIHQGDSIVKNAVFMAVASVLFVLHWKRA